MIKWGVVLALGLSACAVDSVDETAGPTDLDAVARPCGPWGCAQNTASGPDGEVFDELDASQTEDNLDKVRILSVKLGTIPLSVHAERDRLVGVDGAGTRYEGGALNGALMILSRFGVPAFEAQFFLDPFPVAFWGGNTSESVVVYNVMVKKIGADPSTAKSACRENPASPNEWFGTTTSAVIFEGDRYDDDAHTVSNSVGSPWFNIACAGGYPAKLHLLRHTWAGGFGADGVQYWPTAIAQRQTYLRAITADYLGDGWAYTHTGVPLYYGDSDNIYPANLSGSWEAIWNSDGAVCMDRARLDPTVLRTWFPTIPDCPTGIHWTKLGYVITVIP